MAAKKVSLTRDQILTAHDIHGEWLDVPEWGGSIFIRRVSFEGLKEIAVDVDNGVHSGTALLIHCIVDPDTGAPLFTLDDVAALRQKDALVFIRVVDKANEVNALDKDAPKGGAAA